MESNSKKSLEFFSLSSPPPLPADASSRETILFQSDEDKAIFNRTGAMMSEHIKAAAFHFENHGMHMAVIEWDAGLSVPLHNHNETCLYYIERGSIRMGNRELGPGEGMLVPAGQAYGYTAGPEGVRIVEFTTGDKGSSTMTVLDRNLERWQNRMEKAVEALEGAA